MSSPNGSTESAQAGQGLDRRVLAISSVVVLGAIMSILDTTVVNVAINTLARDFDTELSTIQWIVTGYTLALATVIPITGWAADRFGTKRLYMLSIGLFVSQVPGRGVRRQRRDRRRGCRQLTPLGA